MIAFPGSSRWKNCAWVSSPDEQASSSHLVTVPVRRRRLRGAHPLAGHPVVGDRRGAFDMMRGLRALLQRYRHPARYAQLNRLSQVQRLSFDQVQQRQREAFAHLLSFAASNSDYYAECFAELPQPWEHVKPEQVPVLRKQDVFRHRDRILVNGAAREHARLGHTGGSTGMPLSFYYNEAKHELMLAGMLRGFMMSGWRPGQRVLYLWGASRDVGRGGVLSADEQGPLAAERSLVAVEYSEQHLREWVEMLRGWRPALIYGYASALAELAGYILARGMSLGIDLVGVYSTAEMLSEEQRTLIQQAFGCKVFDQYGCREVPNIAWECRHGKMHVFADMVQLESVHSAGEDRLLVTSLTDRLMPFIRYELGDSGRLLADRCDCGLPFPLMEMGMCRHNDLILTADGRRIHPAFFNRLMYGRDAIRQYQWIQHAVGRLELRLVSDSQPLGTMEREIVTLIRRDLDAQMDVEFSYCKTIPRSRSGKHRFVIGLETRHIA